MYLAITILSWLNYKHNDKAAFCLPIFTHVKVKRCRSWEGMEHIIIDLVIYSMTMVKTIVKTSVKVFSIVFDMEATAQRHVFHVVKDSQKKNMFTQLYVHFIISTLCQKFVLVCHNSLLWFSNSNLWIMANLHKIWTLMFYITKSYRT